MEALLFFKTLPHEHHGSSLADKMMSRRVRLCSTGHYYAMITFLKKSYFSKTFFHAMKNTTNKTTISTYCAIMNSFCSGLGDVVRRGSSTYSTLSTKGREILRRKAKEELVLSATSKFRIFQPQECIGCQSQTGKKSFSADSRGTLQIFRVPSAACIHRLVNFPLY